MFSFEIPENAKVLELGGGSNPILLPRCAGGNSINVDVRPASLPDGRPSVDFTADFEKALPVKNGEFDIVLSRFALEHVSYTRTRDLIKEIHRVLKPGARTAVIIPNTEEQLRWILAHPDGWDGKDMFESASCKLFGDQRHGEREGDRDPTIDSHKAYFSPRIAAQLFADVGFEKIIVSPFGERKTDMVIEAVKPTMNVPEPAVAKEPVQAALPVPESAPVPVAPPGPPMGTTEERAACFDRHYFDGGTKVGGYAGMGYADFPVHAITAQRVLDRQPQSVLELGCGRNYIIKRLQDAGVDAFGMDISKHCFMTRAADSFVLHDACNVPWPIADGRFDLVFSMDFFDHVPREFLPSIYAEMLRVGKRGLHGINFEPDGGGDRTRCTIHDRAWWQRHFPEHEVLSKQEFEQGPLPPAVRDGDGKLKLNLGSFITQFHYGWTNIDVHDLNGFSQQSGYRYLRHDLRQGVPFGTGTVDMVMMSHFLEHLSYAEGLQLLRDLRRTMKPDGVLRIAVPDAARLIASYQGYEGLPDKNIPDITVFDEISVGCAENSTDAAKLWEMLAAGHSAFYDAETLGAILQDAGFVPTLCGFRKSVSRQMLVETLDMGASHSVYMDAVPALP